jgi:hypothetical protein
MPIAVRGRIAVCFTVAALTAVTFLGCATHSGDPLSPGAHLAAARSLPQAVRQDLEQLQRIAAAPDRGASHFRTAAMSAAGLVVVPAGSVDALAAAISRVRAGGTVLLEAGEHVEHGTVPVTRRVAIVGETGAILKSDVAPSNDFPQVIRPAIYVHNTTGVTLWNVTLRPTAGTGGTAVLVENAPKTTVGWCDIREFQEAVLLQKCDGSTLMGNTVVSSTAWQSGELIECDGIININGAGVRFANNDISNGVLNAFCSGADGYYLSNRSHDGFVGMILCCVPEESYLLPSGAVVGSEIPSTGWFVHGNDGSNNFYAGLITIDGANQNTLVDNSGSGNGAFDIEMLGTTCLFGFETPPSWRNQLYVGNHPALTINDFGQDNRITGSAVITHTMSAPCSQPQLGIAARRFTARR